MLQRAIIVFALVVSFVCSTSAQEVLSLTEKDQDNKTYNAPNNVDINSQLVLKLDKANLLKKLNGNTEAGSLPAEVVALINDLQLALQKRGEWITSLGAAVKNYEIGKRTDFAAFNATRQQVAIQILALLKDEKLKAYFEQDVSTNIWQQLTNAINRRLAELEDELLRSPAYNDYRVQLGGWLIRNGQSTPLHFEGLDTNPVGEFYEVERWRFLPTAAQLTELQQLEQLARSNETQDASLAEILRSNYVQLFTDELEKKVKKSIADLKAEADKVLTSIDMPVIRTDVEGVLGAAESFRVLLAQKIQFYAGLKTNPSFSLSLLLGTLPNDIVSLNAEQENVRKALDKLQGDLSALSNDVRQKAGLLPQLAADQLKAFAQSFLGRELLDVLQSTSSIADAALEFSDRVFSLSFAELPQDPMTDLRSAGLRHAGDRVVIRLFVTKGEARTRVFQESRDVRLYQILPHTETTVGVVFAHPLAPTAIQKEFQMAPHFNLLFKGLFGGSQCWKRKSSLPNTLLDFSFGIHLSSPDFDKDDVPELGVGIVGSTLKDYLQFGWAYNIFQGTPYVFFGIRLPMPSFGGNPAATSLAPSN